MTRDVHERLREAGRRELSAVYLGPPCDDDSLDVFRRRLREDLGVEGADWYERLLRVSDGLQIDNAIFESSQGLIETNLEFRAEDRNFERYLVLGNSGNVDLYVYDGQRKSQKFCVVNFFGVEEVYEEYPSFEALLTALLDAASL